jgi:hypothetical protein
MPVTINASTSSGLISSADTSGTIELQSDGTTILTVASGGITTTGTTSLSNLTATGTFGGGVITSGTEVASTSGTSIDFTGIPSWVKRVTVMFNGISTSGTAAVYMVQIGSGSVTTTGYLSDCSTGTTFNGVVTTGFAFAAQGGSATYALSGTMTLNLIGSNTWVESSSLAYTNVNQATWVGSGNSSALGGALDRVRITTFAGTDTFDAGSINILYE